PSTPCSQNRCATKLRHAPSLEANISIPYIRVMVKSHNRKLEQIISNLVLNTPDIFVLVG
ncbi:MAG: hypothetical protein ACLFPF_08555, partial [Halanaerobiales bacterium]